MVYQGGVCATNLKRGLMAFVKLHQNIDTLKYHLYPSSVITSKDIESYNKNLDSLISQKLEAQINRNSNKNVNLVKHSFGDFDFCVRPATIKGFTVTVENADLSIHFKKLVITADQSPFAKVEFRASFLQRNGYMSAVKIVNNFLCKHIMSAFVIKISELHLQCDVQGYQFTILDFYRIKSRSRDNRPFDDSLNDGRYYSGRSFQGFMFGRGDYLMRVYNKTREIKKFPNKSYIEELWRLNSSYNQDQDVFRIEFQLRREKLKTMKVNNISLDGFEVILNNLNNIWSRCLNDFSLRDLDDVSCNEIMLGYKTLKNGVKKDLGHDAIRQRYERSNLHPLWSFISSFNGHIQTSVIEVFKKPFTSNFLYVHNAFKAFLSTTLSHYGDVRPSTIEDALHKIQDYTMKKQDQTVIEDVYSKRIDRFNKLEKMEIDEDKLYSDRHYFVRRVFDNLESTYNAFYDDVGVSDVFQSKFTKFLGKAV